MFDDPQTTPPKGQQPPSNLPIGEPEDMFGATEPTSSAPSGAIPEPPAAPSALDAGVLRPAGSAPPTPPSTPTPPAPPAPPSAPEPEDIFAASTPAEPSAPVSDVPAPPPAPVFSNAPLDAPAMQPPRSTETSFGATPEQITTPPEIPQDQQYAIKGPTLSRGIMTIIIVVVALIVLVGGGSWVYYSLIRPSSGGGVDTGTPSAENTVQVPDAFNEADQAVDTDPDTGLQQGLEATQRTPEQIDEQLLFGEPVDSDNDGLDDLLEEDLGTDPSNPDSDSDELSDGDEVLIWNTDPNNPDTDGDSFLDGKEVLAGYSPAGPGKLLQPTLPEKTTEDVTVEPTPEPTPEPEPTPVPEQEPTPVPEPTSEPTETLPVSEPVALPPQEPEVVTTPPASAAAAPITQTVVIANMAFSPGSLTLNVGDTVVWQHNDAAPHTVVSDGNFESQILRSGDSFSQTFTTPGTYTYYCSVHPSMTGIIIVQ